MPRREEVPGLDRHEREELEAQLEAERQELEAMRHEYNLYEGRPDPDDW